MKIYSRKLYHENKEHYIEFQNRHKDKKKTIKMGATINILYGNQDRSQIR